jgi:hypothetical protein
MDFIEGLFGISPDQGSGLTELAFVFVLLFGALACGLKLYRRRRNCL